MIRRTVLIVCSAAALLLAACGVRPGIFLETAIGDALPRAGDEFEGRVALLLSGYACPDSKLPSTETYCDPLILANAAASSDGRITFDNYTVYYGPPELMFGSGPLQLVPTPPFVPDEMHLHSLGLSADSAEQILVEGSVQGRSETQSIRYASFATRACTGDQCVIAFNYGPPAPGDVLAAADVSIQTPAVTCGPQGGIFGGPIVCNSTDTPAFAALARDLAQRGLLTGPYDDAFLFYDR